MSTNRCHSKDLYMYLLIIYSEKCIYKRDYCEIHVAGITGLFSNHAYGWD